MDGYALWRRIVSAVDEIQRQVRREDGSSSSDAPELLPGLNISAVTHARDRERDRITPLPRPPRSLKKETSPATRVRSPSMCISVFAASGGGASLCVKPVYGLPWTLLGPLVRGGTSPNRAPISAKTH